MKRPRAAFKSQPWVHVRKPALVIIGPHMAAANSTRTTERVMNGIGGAHHCNIIEEPRLRVPSINGSALASSM